MESNLAHGTLPCISKPTRIMHTSAMLIDNVFCSESLYAKCTSHILIDDISDHLPCLCTFRNVFPTLNETKSVWKPSLTEKNVLKIQKDLALVDWATKLDQSQTCSEQFCTLQEVIQNTMNTHAPERLVRCKIKPLVEPWLTKGLINCQRKLKKLYKNSISIESMTVTTSSVEKYRCYQSTLQHCKRFAKQHYYRTKCSELRQNTSKLWQLINKITHKTQNKQHIIECLKNEDSLITSSTKIAKTFGSYFLGIGMKLSSKIIPSKTDAKSDMEKINLNKTSLFLYPTTEVEIEKIISKLPNKDSSGYDDISNNFLKKIGKQLLKPLQIIINMSMTKGEFPDTMKLADVVPLHKSKSKEMVTNYRPILLLLTLSKILEKIIYKRTYRFLENTNQIYKSQYGFRSKHSCEQAVGELLSEIIKNDEQKKDTVAVSLKGI